MATDTYDNVQIAVWDEDVTADDLVGEGAIPILTYMEKANPVYNEKTEIRLSYKGKDAGKIDVKVEFACDSGYGDKKQSSDAQ